MKRYILGALIITLLSCGIPMKSAFGTPAEDINDMKQLRKEIHILNLINGLELDRGQMEFILQKAKEAADTREQYAQEIQKKSPEFTSVLHDLRQDLQLGQSASSDLRTKVHKNNKSLYKLKDDYEEKVAQLVASVKNRLAGHQRYSLGNFKPCLIPPEGTPKIGQAHDSKGAEKLLERVRNMTDNVFERRKERVAQQSIDRIRRHLPKGYIIDDAKEQDRIIATFEEARALNDLDFAVEKTNLAERLQSEYELPEMPIDDIAVIIERFLLATEIIPLLQERLSQK